MARCFDCIHYNICSLWSTVDLEESEAHKYCFNNYKTKADVVQRAEVLEQVDNFRSALIDKFIDLCRGNDYNKLTLLKIGDTVDQIYDKQLAELKKKYTEDTE